MQRIKAWTGVVTVFLLGAMAGALVSGYVERREVRNLLLGDRPPQVRVVARILSHLSLTDAQQRQIRAIVDESRPEMTAILDTYRPEMETVFNNAIARIRTVLDPEQKKAFDAGLARMAERLRRFHERNGRQRAMRFRDRYREPDELLSALNPKPDRRAAVRGILETAEAQRRMVRAGFHHRHQALIQEMRRQLAVIDETTLTRLRPLLTDAEIERYKELAGPPPPEKDRGDRPARVPLPPPAGPNPR